MIKKKKIGAMQIPGGGKNTNVFLNSATLEKLLFIAEYLHKQGVKLVRVSKSEGIRQATQYFIHHHEKEFQQWQQNRKQ